MKIYTKTGDEGETALFSGGRVPKDDTRLHAYGTIDELNTVLGVALAQGLEPGLAEMVRRVQSELFSVGADLATPLDAKPDWLVRVDPAMIDQLEAEIDALDEELTPLKHFILPGGDLPAATLHVARTVCRRAERWIVSMGEAANPQALRYINRLSDWLFTMARAANHRAGVEEPVWAPRDS